MKHHRKYSSFLLTLRVRSRSYWTSWRLRRMARRIQREQHRTLALQLALDSSLLRQKELEQQEQQLRHRLQEMRESQQFRSQGLIPQEPLVPEWITLPLLEQPPQEPPSMVQLLQRHLQE